MIEDRIDLMCYPKWSMKIYPIYLLKGGNMEINKISNGQIPPENKYILIYCHDMPWKDSNHDLNVFWRVAKMVRGISEEERNILRNSTNPIEQKRARTYRPGDVFGNITVPYYFDEFGASSYFGQNIDEWCYLPNKN